MVLVFGLAGLVALVLVGGPTSGVWGSSMEIFGGWLVAGRGGGCNCVSWGDFIAGGVGCCPSLCQDSGV